MNNMKQEILQTLKKIMGFYEESPVEPTTEEFETIAEAAADAKVVEALIDHEVKISQREVGGKVERIGAEGELTPIEDGDYEMEDGFKFTVKDGLIASIDGQEDQSQEAPAEKASVQEQAAEEEAPVQDATQEEPSVDEPQQPDLHALLEKCMADIETLKGEVAELKTALGGAKDELGAFHTQVEQLNSHIKTLAKVPVEFSKTTTNNQVKDTKEQQLLELARILGSK